MRSNTAEDRCRWPPRPPALERQNISSKPRAWCCSFAAAPGSPDIRPSHHSKAKLSPPPPSSEEGASAAAKTPVSGSAYSSPSPASKLGRGIVTPRRILSPGRVSPIDIDPPAAPLAVASSSPPASASAKSGPEAPDPEPERRHAAPRRPERAVAVEISLDLRLILKGKDGRCVALDLESSVLCAGSSIFAGMVSEYRRKAAGAAAGARTVVEVAGVEDLGSFRQAIELMYERDPLRLLVKAGVSRAIQILEVYSSIMFESGIMFCLKYIESVPWSETEEEKLKDLFAKGLFAKDGFEEAAFSDVLARLSLTSPAEPNDLAVQLVQSIINGNNNNARKELQALVNGLLSKSSVYEKDLTGLNMESLYNICYSSLNSLVELFAEALNSPPATAGRSPVADDEVKPLVERVSKQVANISWLLEIMIEKQMAADFVAMWANQPQLVEMHERSSPMVRHELSRISAGVFVALGNGRVQCPGDVRSGVIRAWFPAILADFGWLRRFPKGIDARALEEGLGRAILTLPLGQQQVLLLEWVRCFSTRGTDCPNLSGAFQVWWRRSFAKLPPDLRHQFPASPTSQVPSLVHFR